MIEKYKRSQYLKEYNEITQIYNRQMKPLRNPFLIAFIAVYTIVATIIFSHIVIYIFQHEEYYILIFWRWSISDKIEDILSSAFLLYFILATYFIRLNQVICHKDRRLKNLEEKKVQAISGGIYDADA